MNKFSTVTGRIIRLMLALIIAMSYAFAGSDIRPARAALAHALAAGGYHTCILTSAGGVLCWGRNDYGQLGDGTNTNGTTPVNVSGLSSGMIAIAAGFLHTCALTSAGGVQCWGNNLHGQLGNGTNTDSNMPVNVSGLSSGVIAIAAGEYHTCALTSAGGVQCWGWNPDGQLGNGTNTSSQTPVNVNGVSSGVIAIATGTFHTCALTSAGGVMCWGHNLYGQLGNGTNTNSNMPVNVSGLSNGVIALATGGVHTCAVTSAGGVQCWGHNDYGQLGNGTTTNNTTPVNVSGLSSGVIAITAGGFHTCVLKSADGAQCWGRNYEGQLGNGTNTNSTTPLNVSGLSSGVIAIAAGAYHTCALTSGGGVQCLGNNQQGQLGDGTTTNSNTPVNVAGLGEITVFEHDFHLSEVAGTINGRLDSMIVKLNSFDLTNLDTTISSRASQASVDSLSNLVGEIQNLLTTFDLTNLDVIVSSRASQASVDALSGTVGEMQTSVNELHTRMDGVEQSLSTIEASLNGCQVEIALVPNGAGHNGNTLEFYIHTTQASERVEPESVSVWAGGNQMNPNTTTIIPGVTWILLDGSWSDLKDQPLTVEVTTGGQTCSSMIVIQ